MVTKTGSMPAWFAKLMKSNGPWTDAGHSAAVVSNRSGEEELEGPQPVRGGVEGPQPAARSPHTTLCWTASTEVAMALEGHLAPQKEAPTWSRALLR